MCGIYGFYLKRDRSFRVAHDNARELLHHRGPDANGYFTAGRVGLGHTRLSIIDLAGGQQPMHSRDGRYVVVFNGEIYNFQELRRDAEADGYLFATHSDTEVILAFYAKHGVKCVDYFRGMFAFALWDSAEQVLFMARDRLGVKPLYVGETSDGFFFASELRALLALHVPLREGLNFDALAGYFARQYILGPSTAYQKVKKLEPATWMLVGENGQAKIGSYWKPQDFPVQSMPEEEACERLRQLFTEATKLRLISEVPLGAFLSGGVDSSVTVAIMSRLLGRKVKTFSIGFGDASFDEREQSRIVARHCETDHHEYEVDMDKTLPDVLRRILWNGGEPFADASVIPSYYVAQMARREVTVVLSGDGADEVWGGYKRHYHLALLERLNRYHAVGAWTQGRKMTVRLEGLFGRKKRFPVSRMDKLLADPKRSPEILTQQLSAAERSELFCEAELLEANRAFKLDVQLAMNPHWDSYTRFLWYETRTFLAGGVLPKVDLATMLNSLEARSPFLDQRVVEFAFSLPVSVKRPHLKSGKHLIKKTFSDLLPKGHFDRPKMGFSPPLARWLRTALRQWCGDALHSNACGEFLNQSMLKRLFEEHQRGADHQKILWLSAVFASWASER